MRLNGNPLLRKASAAWAWSPLFLAALGALTCAAAEDLSDSLPVRFGLSRLAQEPALAGRAVHIVRDPGLGAESYRLATGQDGFTITAGDAAGAMYGAFELEERLHNQVPVDGTAGRPRFAIRAVKINLPWESYRRHAALQAHDQACRDPAFWTALIDHLALSRFNRLSLWSLHPWHLMVKSKDFPDSSDLSPEEQERWRQLWNHIFNHARARGMEVQIFTWNIFASPAFARARGLATYSIDGSYIGAADRSEVLERYNRSIITQALQEYPNLLGLGITQSERMGGMTPAERRAWIDRVVLQAVKDCGRPVEINLRVPHSAGKSSNGSMDASTERLGRDHLESVQSSLPVLTEIKYNWSHGHSTPKLVKIHGGPISDLLWNPLPTYRITWMVRNEDFFALRWCSPAFVQAHLAENDRPWTGGYYVGSESMIPAVILCEPPDRPSGARWQFERQRLFYTAWGRGLYGLEKPGDLARAIDVQYGSGSGAMLLPILDAAGEVPLAIATWMNKTWDLTLYSEGFTGNDGFITVEKLTEAKPMDPAWIGIRAAAADERNRRAPRDGTVTPLQLADRIATLAETTLKAIAAARTDRPDVAAELRDATAWCHLGLYFADKLRAGMALERARNGGGDADRAAAVAALERCLVHWDAVIAATDGYREHPVPHLTTPFHWSGFRDLVAGEVEAARRVR
jgi:hypothetical protein